MNSAMGYTLVPSSGSVVLIDDTAFATVSLNSGTATTVTTSADNRGIAPPSYTFVTTSAQYMRIFSGQCDRVSNYIFNQLEQLDRADDDQNETIIDSIASVIDLVGEPAAFTAAVEARLLRNQPFLFEWLLVAIATARHKDTEVDRCEFLRQYTNDGDYRVKRAAVRALGRMDTDTAKSTLKDISNHSEGEISRFAAALLR